MVWPALLASIVTTTVPPLMVVAPVLFQLLKVTRPLPFFTMGAAPTMLSPLMTYALVSLLKVTERGLTAPLILTVVMAALSSNTTSSPLAA